MHRFSKNRLRRSDKINTIIFIIIDTLMMGWDLAFYDLSNLFTGKSLILRVLRDLEGYAEQHFRKRKVVIYISLDHNEKKGFYNPVEKYHRARSKY